MELSDAQALCNLMPVEMDVLINGEYLHPRLRLPLLYY